MATSDLFEADDYPRQVAAQLDRVVQEIVVDTAEITQEYLKRPGHLAVMTLGAWFNAAHRLNDRELANSAGSMATKLEILRKGYNKLPLQPLRDWNDRFNAKQKG
jgi:extradiol dioxygenase family protein